jgi:hypothetical protein
VRGLNVWLVLSVAALAAACAPPGASGYTQDHSARQIVTDATSSSASARSYHVTLDESTTEGTAHLDLDVEDGNAAGTITWPSMSVRIIQVGGRTFVNGSDLAALLAPIDVDGATLIKAAAGSLWVLVPPGFWNSRLTDLIDMKNLGGCLRAARGLTKAGTSAVGGRLAVEVDDRTTSKVYVDTAAPHYLVRADIAGGDGCVTTPTASNQVFDWSQYGATFDIAAPSGFVDLKTIG